MPLCGYGNLRARETVDHVHDHVLTMCMCNDEMHAKHVDSVPTV